MSEDVECPRCRGQMIANGPFQFDGPYPLFTAMCVDCDWIGPICQDVKVAFDMCRPMAYFEPRPRLPTKEEEAAHRARHGEGAGWLGITHLVRMPRNIASPLDEATRFLWEGRKRAGWVSVWPHVNGRPVAWPAL